jgi:hypothetical protein
MPGNPNVPTADFTKLERTTIVLVACLLLRDPTMDTTRAFDVGIAAAKELLSRLDAEQ